MSPFWTQSPDKDACSLADIDISLVSEALRSEEELPLTNGPQTEELDQYTDPHQSDDSTSDSALEAAKTSNRSLVGHWGGSYAYPNSTVGDGLVSFTISDHQADGSIVGTGYDTYGPFTIRGTLEENVFTFMKDYQILQYGKKTIWKYVGTVSGERDEIHGIWGYPDADWNLAPKVDDRGILIPSAGDR